MRRHRTLALSRAGEIIDDMLFQVACEHRADNVRSSPEWIDRLSGGISKAASHALQKVMSMVRKIAVALLLTALLAPIVSYLAGFGATLTNLGEAIGDAFKDTWARREVWGVEERRIEVGAVSGYDLHGYPIVSIDYARIWSLFERRELEALNELFAEAQRELATDSRKETALMDMVGAFQVEDERLEAAFSQWVEKTPESFVPWLARGVYHATLAWEVAGCLAPLESSEATPQRKFHYHTLAISDLQAALARQSGLLPAYAVLLLIARSYEGGRIPWEDPVGNPVAISDLTLLEQALVSHPRSYVLRNAAVQGSVRRWNGSYQPTKSLVKAAERLAAENPKLVVLAGLEWLDKGELAWGNAEHDLALAYFNKALGVAIHWSFLEARARKYRSQNQELKALADLNAALVLRPQVLRLHRQRLEVLQALDRSADARAALAEMRRVFPSVMLGQDHLRIVLAALG
ncbi:MAG: hypothetical protein HYV63_22260 [Candidatus Schekmanbacteria bacterium]|nr:hypothetical protein [Candidatus Schekmanbacteria bacterium]